jgi:hypothetical protein
METDFISRSKLLETLNREKIPFNADVNYFIMNAPAADVRPVVRGKWITYRPDCRPVCDWKCSACGYDPDLGWQPFFNYCPNCGADMREAASYANK